MNRKSLEIAREAFNKRRSSVMKAFDYAVKIYHDNFIKQLCPEGRELELDLVDINSGEGTGVLVKGFANADEANKFISELMNEDRS